MEKYIVYYSFIIEAQDIEIAEKEARDISEKLKDTQVKDVVVTVRGIS